MKTFTLASNRSPRLSTLVPSVLFASFWLGGCSDPAKDPEPGPAEGTIVLTEANNFESVSALDVPTQEVAAGADLDICWTDVDQDIQCHDVDPEEELNNVTLLRFLNLSESDVEKRLTSGQLPQSAIDGFLEYNTTPDSTCTKLSELNFFGTPIEIEEEFKESDDHVYMLLLTKGTSPGIGARTMTFLRPSANSSVTEVQVPTGCGMLAYEANLSSLDPVSIPKEGPWEIDWRDVKHDGEGNTINQMIIDSVLLAFYEGRDVAYLEENILDIELIATGLWEVELDGGRSADLADAKAREGGEAFPGFETDAEGVWLMGLMCSTCQNPAPVMLTVLELE